MLAWWCNDKGDDTDSSDKIASAVGSGTLGCSTTEASCLCVVWATGADEYKLEVDSYLPDDTDRDLVDTATMLLAPNLCMLPTSEV